MAAPRGTEKLRHRARPTIIVETTLRRSLKSHGRALFPKSPYLLYRGCSRGVGAKRKKYRARLHSWQRPLIHRRHRQSRETQRRRNGIIASYRAALARMANGPYVFKIISSRRQHGAFKGHREEMLGVLIISPVIFFEGRPIIVGGGNVIIPTSRRQIGAELALGARWKRTYSGRRASAGKADGSLTCLSLRCIATRDFGEASSSPRPAKCKSGSHSASSSLAVRYPAEALSSKRPRAPKVVNIVGENRGRDAAATRKPMTGAKLGESWAARSMADAACPPRLLRPGERLAHKPRAGAGRIKSIGIVITNAENITRERHADDCDHCSKTEGSLHDIHGKMPTPFSPRRRKRVKCCAPRSAASASRRSARRNIGGGFFLSCRIGCAAPRSAGQLAPCAQRCRAACRESARARRSSSSVDINQPARDLHELAHPACAATWRWPAARKCCAHRPAGGSGKWSG